MSRYGDTTLKEMLYDWIQMVRSDYGNDADFLADLAAILADYVEEIVS